MGMMKERMIRIMNEEKELYGYIKKTIESDYDITQKLANILAKCKDFERRNSI